jgi:hypothetical protein
LPPYLLEFEVKAGVEGIRLRKILATYQVNLAGFNLGEFRLTATFQGPTYEMQGNGRFSLLAGRLYSGTGITTSTGKLTKAGPEPSSFSLSYKGGGKKDQRRMSFADGGVSQFSITPRKKQSRRRVPVTKEQLEDVLDPLSAGARDHTTIRCEAARVCRTSVTSRDNLAVA